MFLLKNKLEPNLKMSLQNSFHNSYRVLIKCKNFQSDIKKKISSLKGSIIRSIDSIGIICASLSPKAIDRLIEYPQVQYICFDEYAHLCAMSISTANGGRFSEKYKFSGRGISIGLIDSGVFPHSDLLIPSNKIKIFVDLINSLEYPYDDNGHGTFMAGVLCGSGYASKHIYRGVAEKSELCCYKAFDATGKGYISNILYAIQSLIENSDIFNIKIICLPFEFLTHNLFITSCFHKLFELATSKNIIPIIPSGSNLNEEKSINHLAISPNCLTVAGLDTSKSVATPYIYSSSGNYNKIHKPDLSAGCSLITSLNCDKLYISQKNGFKIYPSKLQSPYTSYSGTSIAAAYISGICALLLESKPNLGFKDVVSLLKLSCDPIDEGKDSVGEGTININKLFS